MEYCNASGSRLAIFEWLIELPQKDNLEHTSILPFTLEGHKRKDLTRSEALSYQYSKLGKL